MKIFAFAIAAWLAFFPAFGTAGNAIPVLMYHSITDDFPPGDTVTSPARFAEQMQYLASQNYQTLSIDELVGVLRGHKPMPDKAVVLTFDDGMRRVLPAIPILDKHGFKASFWIVTSMLNHPYYLNWDEVKALARNSRFEVQSHTRTHPWHPFNNLLAWAEDKVPGKGMADVRAELVDSKRELEAQLGRPVDYLAWPLGLYNEAMIALARHVGYKALLTTDDGVGNVVGADVMRIKRVGINGRCDLATFIGQLADHLDRDMC